MLKQWIVMVFLLLVSVGATSAQDGGSTLQAWADTPASAINLTPQMTTPQLGRAFAAINTYTATGDPVLSCASGGHDYSLWTTFVAPQTGVVVVTAVGSNYDAAIGLFRTTATNPFRCVNDSSSSGETEVLNFKMVAGTRYYLMFAVAANGTGVDGTSSLQISITTNAFLQQPFQIPASGSYSIVQTEIENALSGQASLGPCGTGDYLVYYSFKPTVSGRYEFLTSGSNYDTVIVYAEYPVPSPVQAGCHQDISATNVNSRLRATLTAGRSYVIIIAQNINSSSHLTDNMLLSLRVRKM